MIQHLVASRQQALLPLGEIIAGLIVKNDTERAWLKGRFAMYEDIFEDSWVYQEIIGKGIQQQRAQEIQRQHQVLHFLLQRYFPDLLSPQHTEIETITDPEVLQNLIFKVGAAQTAQQAQHAIDAIRATHD
jgi:hypothetical protein